MANDSFEKQVLQALGSLQKGQAELKGGLDRVELLQEEMRDDITKLAEGVAGVKNELAHKAEQNDIDDLKVDIKTIKAAVRATNKDLPHRLSR